MNKAINNIILTSIFVVPMASIIPIHGTIVWYPQLLALMVLGFICLAMLFWDTNKYISILLIYATFSYIFVCSQSPRAMLCLISGYAGMIFSYFVSRSDTSNLYKAIAVCATINIILVVLQIFKIDPFFSQTSNWLLDRTVGFVGSRNQLGVFYATVSTVLMDISPWFLLMGLPILLVKCSSAFVGLYAGVSTFVLLKGFQKTSVFLFICLLSGSILWMKFGDKNIEIQERIRLWELSISQTINGELKIDESNKIVKSNPWFGYGLGNFFVFSPHSQTSIIYNKMLHRYEHAHNDLVEAFFEFGYIGLVLVLLSAAKIISDFIECLHMGHPKTSNLIVTFCALVSISVCSMGVYVFHAPVSLFLFCLVLGLFYKEVNNAKQSQIA